MAKGSHEERVALTGLIQVVEELRKIDPKMELGQMLVLLLVLARPGIRSNELPELTGLSRSSVSRNLLALSRLTYLTDDNGKNLPGKDLLEQFPDPSDRRTMIVAPSRKGRDLNNRLVAFLNGDRR